jgi:hypothetical protein
MKEVAQESSSYKLKNIILHEYDKLKDIHTEN